MKKKNKLGVSYSLFCGEELLRASIMSIREQVDYINVVWQEYSWTGERVSDDVEVLINTLLKEGLIQNSIKFEFQISSNARKNSANQCKKRNIGIKDLQRAGCTHGMIMDVDEFYRKEEFRQAKEFVYSNKITHSVCSIYDYRISPLYRMRDARDYCVSFIFKLSFLSRVVGRKRINNMPCYIDSFRTVPFLPLIHKFFYLNMVSMHHMTGVRKDYEKKLRNTLSNYSEEGRAAIKEYGELQRRMEMISEEEILVSGGGYELY